MRCHAEEDGAGVGVPQRGTLAGEVRQEEQGLRFDGFRRGEGLVDGHAEHPGDPAQRVAARLRSPGLQVTGPYRRE